MDTLSSFRPQQGFKANWEVNEQTIVGAYTPLSHDYCSSNYYEVDQRDCLNFKLDIV